MRIELVLNPVDVKIVIWVLYHVRTWGAYRLWQNVEVSQDGRCGYGEVSGGILPGWRHKSKQEMTGPGAVCHNNVVFSLWGYRALGTAGLIIGSSSVALTIDWGGGVLR